MLNSKVKRLACTEVWGGNRHIESQIVLGGMTGYLYSQPCGSEKGGDIVYLTACGSGAIARACIADVTGHGQQVAQVGDWLQDVLRRRIDYINPVRVFDDLNQRIVQRGLEAMATALCISYNSFLRRLHLCHAGHPFLFKYSVDEKRWDRLFPERNPVMEDGLRNAILGVSADVNFDLVHTQLHPGDRLVMYSDGVLEAANPDMELFGEQRLLEQLGRSSDLSDQELTASVIKALKDFAATDSLAHDDVTIIVLTAEDQPRPHLVWRMVKNRLLGLRNAVLGGEKPLAGVS